MLHHVEIYVSDLEKSIAFWTPFMKLLDYEDARWSGGITYMKKDHAYFCFLPASSQHLDAGYHRKRIGLNHLAFQGTSKAHVDQIANWVRNNGYTLLYQAKYPNAGGPNHYALFCEDPDRIKVEVAAPDEA